MIKLLPKSAAAGLTPIKISNTKIMELDDLALTSISAYKGNSKNLSEQLKNSHGMALPHYGRATGREGMRALWFGRHTLLVGPNCDEKLAKFAIIQSEFSTLAPRGQTCSGFILLNRNVQFFKTFL